MQAPQPVVTRQQRQRARRSDAASDSSARGDLEEVFDAFVTIARALVALAVRSINASPIEVTLMQHRVLILLGAGGEQSVSALAEQLGVNASNASRACGRLQRLGLVSRRRSTTDARLVKVTLTDDGIEVLRVVSEHRRSEVRRILATVTPYVVARTP